MYVYREREREGVREGREGRREEGGRDGETEGRVVWIFSVLEKQEKGDGQNGGWLRTHVEAPTCETFTRL